MHSLPRYAMFLVLGLDVVLGVIVGMTVPTSELPGGWRWASSVIGWLYFFFWSSSFYPQFLLNCRYRSVVGLSFDFQLLNFLGFLLYSVYNVTLMYVPLVRQQYVDIYHSKPEITVNDLVFSIHALVLTSLVLLQIAVFDRGKQRFAMWSIMFTLGVVLMFFILMVLVGAGVTNWFIAIYSLSIVKLVISICKYVPQAVLNFRNKSTSGWSVENVVLDMCGGVLSFAQLMMESALKHNLAGIAGNPVKLILGLLSIAFDVLFLVQHYCLYTRNPSQSKI